MKKVIFALLGAMIITFASCTKDNVNEQDNNEIQYKTAEDVVISEDFVNDIESEVDEAISAGFDSGIVQSRSCRTVTVTPDDGSFPKTITIDFGDGCTLPNGKVKSGKIITVITGPRNESGSSRTTTFEDHFVDDVQITGTLFATNNGNYSFTRTVNLTLFFPDDTSIELNSEKTITQVTGMDTPPRIDDVFEIEGFANGTNRAGNTFSTEITETLIRKGNCRWVTDGVREVTRNGQTASIDYGFGPEHCNNLAEVTLPNGNTRVIRIERNW